jgi:hypothetical protein
LAIDGIAAYKQNGAGGERAGCRAPGMVVEARR